MKRFITIGVDVPDSTAGNELYQAIRKKVEGLMEIEPGLTWAISTIPFHLELEDVRDFHNKFLVPMSPEPAFLDDAAHQYRSKFLQEELDEFGEAFIEKDLAKAGDALIDLVYVALGTALMMGLPWQQMWPLVQTANMAKRLAKPDGSDSKRNNPLDVIKPEGWTAPDHWPLMGMGRNHSNYRTFDATAAVLALTNGRKGLPPVGTVQDAVDQASGRTPPSQS